MCRNDDTLGGGSMYAWGRLGRSWDAICHGSAAAAGCTQQLVITLTGYVFTRLS